jgi:hypothetical protein
MTGCAFAGTDVADSDSAASRFWGFVFRHPYALSAAMSAYGLTELAKSAIRANDTGLIAISIAYAIGISFLPLLDMGAETKYEASDPAS